MTMQLSILDAITEPGNGFFGEGGISSQAVAASLAGSSPLEPIDLTLNSPGGSVVEGISIYNQLALRPGGCTVTVMGMAASIASLIAMAASPGKLRIAEGSVIMLHNPRARAMGEADDLRATADKLDMMRRQMVGIYARRSGMTPARIEALMDAETWMDADEAIRLGLADAKVEPLQMAASAHDRAAFDWLNPRTPALGEDNMSTKILAALGVESEDSLQAIEEAAGTKGFAAIVAILKDGKALTSAVAEVTGKTGAEALGALHAIKASADAYAEAKAKLDAAEAESARVAAERAKAAAVASVDAAVTAGRLPPASKERALALLDSHGDAVLAAFLDAFPVRFSAPPVQPPTPVAHAAEDDTAERARVAAGLGVPLDKANEYAARLAAAQE